MAKNFLGLPWRFLPTHWFGGRSTAKINRIYFESDSFPGIILYIEHHGTGKDNDKYPTAEDYERAQFVLNACNSYHKLLATLENMVKNCPACMTRQLVHSEEPICPDCTEAMKVIAAAKFGEPGDYGDGIAEKCRHSG